MLYKSGGIEFINSIQEDAVGRLEHCREYNQTTLTWGHKALVGKLSLEIRINMSVATADTVSPTLSDIC